MLIALNWKSYVQTKKEAKALSALLVRKVGRSKHQYVVCPPAPFAHLITTRKNIFLGAQDVSLQKAGAHTGEITAEVLAEAKVEYVIVGHSERRAAGESEETVAAKTVRVLSQGMTPIVCVGESSRDSSLDYLSVLRAQVSSVLFAVPEVKRGAVVFAYEPLWAINNGDQAMKSEELYETIAYIRKIILEHTSDAKAKKAILLYGGSVEHSNITYLMQEGGVNGFLIGHASADSKKLAALIEAVG